LYQQKKWLIVVIFHVVAKAVIFTFASNCDLYLKEGLNLKIVPEN
jgi:hypothetical protein